ncbi:C2H2 zinc finger [Ceratobasidium sp. AG-Ba]|nr:C2H2 zinc finger [Ceratobasidium sp. AG-Ba]
MQAHETSSGLDHYRSGSSESFFDVGSLHNLYLGNTDNTHLAPLHIDIPGPSTDRRASEATVRLPLHQELSFESLYPNVSVGSDTWSPAAYSSPSPGSFNSSSSIQNNTSGSGTPFLPSDQPHHQYDDSLLSVSLPSIPRVSMSSPSLSTSSEPLIRYRRGAISEQGCQASARDLNRPMLAESIASQLYADDFQVETVTQLASSVSRPDNQALTPSSFQGADSPSGSTTSANKSQEPTRDDVMVGYRRKVSPDTAALNGRSSPAKSGDSDRYHPYPRTYKMSEHERVIQFDNVPVAQTSRKPSKRTRGTKRCYCTYVCPVQKKRCDGSVSREADMGRHMHKHKAEEEELIASGRLNPQDATDFGELKPTGAAVCKGCNIQMSRRDALVR